MRCMSFALTQRQMRRREKEVTRRRGWWFLKPGDVVLACAGCRGVPVAAREEFGPVRILSTEGVVLKEIDEEEVAREGFPGMRPEDFVDVYCELYDCSRSETVNRIEFEFVEEDDGR